MANTGKNFTSWGWIIFWFILFWPVGLFLLFKKQSIDKSAMLKNTKTLFIVSYILIFMGVFCPIMAITGNLEETEESMNPVSTSIVMVVLFGGGGVLLNIKARQMKTMGDRYKKYIAIVINQNQTSIDNIAPAIGVPYEVTAKDLQKMIDTGYFVGAYIDATQREIVLAKTTPQQVSQDTVATQTQIKIVICGSCGANNRVATGQIAECEYCGSPLQ